VSFCETVQIEEHVSEEEAEAALTKLRQMKEKRGYQYQSVIGIDAAEEHAIG
jgi:hypothetical protein